MLLHDQGLAYSMKKLFTSGPSMPYICVCMCFKFGPGEVPRKPGGNKNEGFLQANILIPYFAHQEYRDKMHKILDKFYIFSSFLDLWPNFPILPGEVHPDFFSSLMLLF